MKRKGKTKAKVERAFHEVFHNAPHQVAATMAKKGPVAAQKQRVAIALDKARRSGAHIKRSPRGK
jgi:carbamoylphosphate synthase large subunit